MGAEPRAFCVEQTRPSSGSWAECIGAGARNCSCVPCRPGICQLQRFTVFEGCPWRLAAGDIDANLDTFAADPEVSLDPIANKVKRLAQAWMTRERLKAGVSLLQEIPWSTTPVEQAHASAARLQRYHPEYGTSMLAARATLHQCRHLFLTPPEVHKAEKAEARLAALQKKNPFKFRGSNAFLAELVGVRRLRRKRQTCHKHSRGRL